MLKRANFEQPLNVLFLITSMDVGGAETLLVNMMRRFAPDRIVPQVACLKQAGELGEQLAPEFRVHSHLIRGKFDAWVLRRLSQLMRREKIDAIVTVGAGDKMFWGRLAARRAKVPVITSALHSTGWPDGVGRLNRMLTPITDGFIAVAQGHRDFLVDHEGCPESKVFLIPNGVDTDRFVFNLEKRQAWRKKYSIPMDSPVCGIVAALREEKNHDLFLNLCDSVSKQIPNAHFLIVGEGVCRPQIETLRGQLESRDRIHLTGNSHDISGALSAMDVFALTSRNEASPVSILEAMAVGLPVVAPRVGSIAQAVLEKKTGYLAESGDQTAFHESWLRLLQDANLRREFGAAGRERVLQYGSLDAMTEGYTDLLESLWRQNTGTAAPRASAEDAEPSRISPTIGSSYAPGTISHSG